MKAFRLISICAALIMTIGIESCGLHKRTTPKQAPKASSNAPQKSSTKDVRNKYAPKIGVSASSLKNKELYAFIDDWYGVTYRYGGTTQSGVDCSGFVGALYKDVYKKQLPRTTRDLNQASKSISKDRLEEGDLVFFDINGKKGSHVGVYLANNRFVHASTSKGVIISDLQNPYYKKAFSHGGKI